MNEVYLFLVCFTSICIQAQIFNEDDYLSDYPPFYPLDRDREYTRNRKTEVVRHQSGTDMVLKCTATSCFNHKQKISWKFKACQPDFKKVPCAKFSALNLRYFPQNFTWDKPLGHVARKKCTFNLQLQNISDNHSGLYRCSDHNKVLKMYELIVIDSGNQYAGQPPELLDVIPSNITILQNMQIIIQCKVYSKQPPEIWWFKQSDGTNYDIQYYDKFYHKINTSIPVSRELNVYLSKLNIYRAREVDSGVYVCVAITESGKDYKDAVVKVVVPNLYWETHGSFLLLFLIPVAFALVPVIVWLCYYRKKKKNSKKIAQQQKIRLIRPKRIVVSDNAFV